MRDIQQRITAIVAAHGEHANPDAVADALALSIRRLAALAIRRSAA